MSLHESKVRGISLDNIGLGGSPISRGDEVSPNFVKLGCEVVRCCESVSRVPKRFTVFLKMDQKIKFIFDGQKTYRVLRTVEALLLSVVHDWDTVSHESGSHSVT